MKNKLFFLLRFVISIGLISIIIYLFRDQGSELIAILKTVKHRIMLFSLIVFAGHTFLLAYRLKVLLFINHCHIPFWRAVVLNFYGLFFNNFLPTSVGGDLIKSVYINKITHNKYHSLSVVLVDRIIGVLTFILFCILSVTFLGEDIISVRVKQSILASILIFVALVFGVSNKVLTRFFGNRFPAIRRFSIVRKIVDLHEMILSHRKDGWILGYVFLISIIGQVVGMSAIYVMCIAIGADITCFMVFLLMPIVFISAVTPSINGLGVREGLFIMLFSSIIGSDQALALSILYLSVYTLAGLVGGVLYLFERKTDSERAGVMS